jgi:hypothetical protein
MKKFWFSTSLGRDIMIAEAESENHLQEAFKVIENEETDVPKYEHFIISELSEKEYIEEEDGEQTMFNAHTYVPLLV